MPVAEPPTRTRSAPPAQRRHEQGIDPDALWELFAGGPGAPPPPPDPPTGGNGGRRDDEEGDDTPRRDRTFLRVMVAVFAIVGIFASASAFQPDPGNRAPITYPVPPVAKSVPRESADVNPAASKPDVTRVRMQLPPAAAPTAEN